MIWFLEMAAFWLLVVPIGLGTVLIGGMWLLVGAAKLILRV
jgi:hypothetical protein